MGDRGQVLIEDEGVYLYTHWNATKLVEDVRRALVRKERWGNSEYLARIIFCEMVGKDGFDCSTGYGISSTKHGDAHRLVKVNSEKETVEVLKDGEREFKGTFSEFIDKFAPQPK